MADRNSPASSWEAMSEASVVWQVEFGSALWYVVVRRQQLFDGTQVHRRVPFYCPVTLNGTSELTLNVVDVVVCVFGHANVRRASVVSVALYGSIQCVSTDVTCAIYTHAKINMLA